MVPMHMQSCVTLRILLQAFLINKEPVGFVGNRTECALLMLLRGWGLDYKAIRDSHGPMVLKVWDFDSAKKMASVIIKTSTGLRLYNKVSSTSGYNALSLTRNRETLQQLSS